MKKAFLKYFAGKARSHNKTQRHSTPADQVHSIGILFTTGDPLKRDAVETFRQKLESEGKVVSILEYIPTRKIVHVSGHPGFSPDEISFFGKIKSHDARRFWEQEFDYLLLADAEPEPAVLQILAKSKAKCRAGKNNPEMMPYLDFLFDYKGGTTELLEGLYAYCSKLS